MKLVCLQQLFAVQVFLVKKTNSQTKEDLTDQQENWKKVIKRTTKPFSKAQKELLSEVDRLEDKHEVLRKKIVELLYEIRPPKGGEAACEYQGFNQRECAKIGCCHWSEQEGLGCMSSVGTGKCEPTDSISYSQSNSQSSYSQSRD